MSIKLKNVRISFPKLWTPEAYTEGQKPKYGATLIMDKDRDAKQIEKIEDAIDEVVESKLKGKMPSDDKICLRDGEEKEELEGFGPDVMFVNASNAVRPLVLNSDRSPVYEEDGIIYPGCYVNAIIDIWAQDNKYGKRVNASLAGVQFKADGESLGGSRTAREDDFDDESDDDDEDEAPRPKRSRSKSSGKPSRSRRSRRQDDDDDDAPF